MGSSEFITLINVQIHIDASWNFTSLQNVIYFYVPDFNNQLFTLLFVLFDPFYEIKLNLPGIFL